MGWGPSCQSNLQPIAISPKSKTESWRVLGRRKVLDTHHLPGLLGSIMCWTLKDHSVDCDCFPEITLSSGHAHPMLLQAVGDGL